MVEKAGIICPIACFKKWQPAHQSPSWLRCDVDSSDKSIVDLLWCRQHDDSIRGMKNYSVARVMV